MSTYRILNNVEHQNLRVITERSEKYGDNVMCALTFPIEFRNIQSCYPIFFRKDGNSGQLFPIALFGFKEGENLFLGDSGWDASYIPAMVQRQPFLVGFQEGQQSGGEKQRVISIDMEHPRVSETEGEALFLEHGGKAPLLEKVAELLEAIYQGNEMNSGFVNSLLEHELLEAFTMEIELKDGSQHKLMGLYTINEDKLKALDGEALDKLHKAGYLLPIFMTLASLSRVRTLIDRKNARLPEQE